MKTYTIEEGSHSSGVHFKLHSGKNQLKFYAKFSADCLYDLGNSNNHDINKLYGLTWGLFNDKNSFRIGWNCSAQNGKIQLYAYIHRNGVRSWESIGEVDVEQEFEVYVEFDRTGNIILVSNSEGYVGFINYNFNGVVKYGYYNWPYFGGDEVAPHTMNIQLSD